ncbi:ATP-binding protein [Streptomyces sp. NPDC002611]
MNATASTVKTLHVARLHLVTAASAVAVAREFVHLTVHHWKLDDYTADATLMMSELVSNAVKATGFYDRQPMPWEITAQHVMALQLRAVGDELYVEVWDRSPHEPVKQHVTADAEGGRGLHLVEALSQKWGIYHPPAGGKIVWALLTTTKLPNPELDGRTLQLRVPDELNPQPGPVKDQASIALMQRVLDGLRNLL